MEPPSAQWDLKGKSVSDGPVHWDGGQSPWTLAIRKETLERLGERLQAVSNMLPTMDCNLIFTPGFVSGVTNLTYLHLEMETFILHLKMTWKNLSLWANFYSLVSFYYKWLPYNSNYFHLKRRATYSHTEEVKGFLMVSDMVWDNCSNNVL